MKGILRKHLRQFALMWSYAYLFIAMGLYVDLFDRNPPQSLVSVMIAAATIMMCVAGNELMKVLPRNTVLSLTLFPSAAMVAIYIMGKILILTFMGGVIPQR